jgi:hypothetical protein
MKQLTPWRTVVFEKLIVAQLDKILPAFYGTGVSIAVFARFILLK